MNKYAICKYKGHLEVFQETYKNCFRRFGWRQARSADLIQDFEFIKYVQIEGVEENV
jgi:hypothetical protein